MGAIRNRYDFVYLFDVTDGNPNGDPDAGGLPRLDPETHQGLVSDVCLKRKVRNYVTLAKGAEAGYRIYVAERAILEHRQGEAWDAVMGPQSKASPQSRSKLPRDEEKARALIQWMCANFYDVRAFGAVMSTTAANCGQVRGPVQLTFARSVEPVLPLEVAITRVAVTTQADAESKGDIRTMGRKYIVPYGLYRAHGYVSAPLAAKGTGFSESDLELLWAALEQMFDHDRSAARGEMAPRRLIAFRHASALGNAPAHRLFERVSVRRVVDEETADIRSPGAASCRRRGRTPTTRCMSTRGELPSGVDVLDRI